jgi:hypothetical protein
MAGKRPEARSKDLVTHHAESFIIKIAVPLGTEPGRRHRLEYECSAQSGPI